ncbi:hypothetical protein AVEN_118259-1 [Araneus ventricosus]|uniref:Uncharacterized protein n=1 Tax=Araneus ventricosus TaxID=182803 RepID=A0A4Y2DXV7_ARAVE|nr:hypothetical protein AVEN_118259-1 [Araneus ventricosus]
MRRTTPAPASSFPNFRAAFSKGHLTRTDIMCTRPAYTAVLRSYRVSNLQPSGPDAQTLPPGHRGPNRWTFAMEEKQRVMNNLKREAPAVPAVLLTVHAL